MTMNICIFGNSHIAALRDGFKRYEGAWPDLNLTFVGAHQNALAETYCENGILSPNSADAKTAFQKLAGVDEVDLRQTDAIVVAGCGFALSRAAWLYRQARWADLPSIRANPAPSSKWSLVSKPAFSAMLQTKLIEELAGRFIRILRRDIDTPIYMCSQPRTTTAIMSVGKHSLDIIRIAINTGDAEAISDMYEANAYTVCEALGATYVTQAPRTIKNHIMTGPSFTKGAIRLTETGRYAQPKDDLLHANATYGKVVLDQINAQIMGDLADVK